MALLLYFDFFGESVRDSTSKKGLISGMFPVSWPQRDVERGKRVLISTAMVVYRWFFVDSSTGVMILPFRSVPLQLVFKTGLALHWQLADTSWHLMSYKSISHRAMSCYGAGVPAKWPNTSLQNDGISSTSQERQVRRKSGHGIERSDLWGEKVDAAVAVDHTIKHLDKEMKKQEE